MKMIVKICKSLFVVAVFFLLISIASTVYAEAIIIDHTCTDINQVPEYWISLAKDLFNLSYGHTSHGSQIVTGMDMVIDEHGALYDYDSVTSSCPFDGAFLCDRYPSGDLGNPDRTTWAQRTRDLLNNANNDRNVIIWSWCGQHDTTEGNINLYLSQMNQLEQDYPDVVFVYMTGHLNVGSGPPAGNTFLRNEQIRQYCVNNSKILFDFADIESWDPDGNDHRDDDDTCNWCADWCSTHSCPSCGSCAHSHCFNCYQKGKAFWWMMARLAGWGGQSVDYDGDGIIDPEDNCTDDYNPLQEDTLPPQGNNIGDACDCECDFDCDGNVDAVDVTSFLGDFGRSTFNNPCTNADPCNGDVDCSSGVDAFDVGKFLEDFGRSQFNDPCPNCIAGDWCVYP